MAHEVETMAYANQVPWHGLGVPVRDDMTPNEMLEAASLNWTVSKRPAYTMNMIEISTLEVLSTVFGVLCALSLLICSLPCSQQSKEL